MDQKLTALLNSPSVRWFTGLAMLLIVLAILTPDNAPSPAEPPRLARAAVSVEAPPQPVSQGCKDLAEASEREGVIEYAGMTGDGATMLVESDWAKMPVDAQRTIAECVSHYVARGQDRWVKKISFVHQQSGVTLGTMEYTRYRVGH